VGMHFKHIVPILAVAALSMVGPATSAAADAVTRSTADYTIPNVTLTRADGKSVSLPEELNDGRPVVMDFFFTTCGSICPLLTQTLARVQEELGAGRDKVHLVSISIDPEADTPAVLTQYARRYHAGPEWHLYTGSMDAIITTAKAFNVYRGNKMAHTPVTLVRTAPGKPWVRFDGFASSQQLVQEIRSGNVASQAKLKDSGLGNASHARSAHSHE
jgi:protein SCO1